MKQTEEELCAEYDAFLNRTGLPACSADELWHELADRINRGEQDARNLRERQDTLREQQDWVWRFWSRWDAMRQEAR